MQRSHSAKKKNGKGGLVSNSSFKIQGGKACTCKDYCLVCMSVIVIAELF